LNFRLRDIVLGSNCKLQPRYRFVPLCYGDPQDLDQVQKLGTRRHIVTHIGTLVSEENGSFRRHVCWDHELGPAAKLGVGLDWLTERSGHLCHGIEP
jgi:hypothetical protein